MALGGSSISWNEANPPGSQAVGLGDDRIRSMKTDIRNGLDSEHVWPSSGGTVGQHRPGSARAFYGTQSRVSASDTSVVADGRMMITSDTSKLFGVGSEGTLLLGAGPLAMSLGSYVPITFPQRLQVAVEVGRGVSDANGEFTVTFGSAFSARPFLLANPASVQTTHTEDIRLLSCTASAFTGMTVESGTGALESNRSFEWIAIGHRAI